MSLKRLISESAHGDIECQIKRKSADIASPCGGILPQFWSWCVQSGMKISPKVKLSDSCVHRYGMVATDAIEKSEILFEIPQSLFLWEENNSSNRFPGLSCLESESGWVRLLLVLMLEYTNGEYSKWWPYLQFSPPTDVLDTPIFWPSEVRREILTGTSLLELVENDVQNITKEYTNIALPYIEANSALGFDKNKHTLGLFTRMVGFVMAYSFTNPDNESTKNDPPKMVPMADVLNHVSRHNAHLQFDEDSWKMVAVRNIQPHEEVFNTFGFLSNNQLLQMYGFVEENSSSDTVDIPAVLFKECPGIQSKERKWNYLFNNPNGALFGCDSIVVGKKGILSCDEAKLILKVLPMSSSEFDSYDGDDWESSSDSDESNSSEESVYAIRFEKLRTYDSPQKALLKHVGKVYSAQLHELLQRKKDIMFPDQQNKLRLSKVVTLLEGQISILNTLVLSCS